MKGKIEMKGFFKIIACLLLISTFCLAVCSCKKIANIPHDAAELTALDYSEINAADHVASVTYKGLTVTLDTADASREDAVWEEILKNANISSYPEEQVEYYFRQEKAYYMYLVNNDEEDYATLLSIRGISEEDMLEDARRMVAKDLIHRFVADAEGIELTEEDKTGLFDRYVEKFVSDYGYTKSYVAENMADSVYESMLYDKTMEYIILQNTFITPNE